MMTLLGSFRPVLFAATNVSLETSSKDVRVEISIIDTLAYHSNSSDVSHALRCSCDEDIFSVQIRLRVTNG
jgi:hypothetical protein